MAGSLMEEWGLGEPAPQASGDQFEQFKASFTVEMDAVAACMETLATTAGPAEQDPFLRKQAVAFDAYQMVLKELQNGDGADGPAACDKVLSFAQQLRVELESSQDDLGDAYSSWQASRYSLEAAGDRIDELDQAGQEAAAGDRNVVLPARVTELAKRPKEAGAHWQVRVVGPNRVKRSSDDLPSSPLPTSRTG